MQQKCDFICWKPHKSLFLLFAKSVALFCCWRQTFSIIKNCSHKKLVAFIGDNLKYPKTAMDKKVEGKALISFVINSQGLVENIKILENPGQGCGEEAVRVVELMNSKGMKWVPAQKDGKAVAVDFKLPFQFKLPK